MADVVLRKIVNGQQLATGRPTGTAAGDNRRGLMVSALLVRVYLLLLRRAAQHSFRSVLLPTRQVSVAFIYIATGGSCSD